MVEQTEIKNAILSLNKEHPDWDSGQLSETLGIEPDKIRYYCRKNNIKLPRKMPLERRKYKDGDIVGDYGNKLLYRTYATTNKKWKGKFQCGFCGREFEAIISDVKSDQCKSCGCQHNHIEGEKVGPYKNQFIKRLYQSNSLSKLWVCEFKCSFCGKHFTARISDVVSGDVASCGCQSFISKGEDKIKQILTNLNVNFIRQYTFDDCISDKNAKLRFDFYLPDYNLCIEYDGEQHFRPTGYFGGEETFQRRMELDKVKNEYCRNNNIHLIRIPYTNFKDIDENYINSLLNRECE